MRLLLILLLFISCKKEQEIESKVLCIELEESVKGGGRGKPKTEIQEPLPSSFSILVDFNGHYVNSGAWNGGVPFYAEPSGLTDTIIVLNAIKSKYKNFNVTITNDSLQWAKASYKTRLVVTTTNFYGGVSGVAYVGSLRSGTEAFVFSNICYYDTKRVWVASTHEIGHTIGLYHQANWDANCSLISSYKSCDWSTGRGPIMGNAISCEPLWWIGPTPYGCKDIQNDSIFLINNLK